MSLTAQDIAAIVSLLEGSSFNELSLEMGGLKLHLRRGNAATELVRRVESSSGLEATSLSERSLSSVAEVPTGHADVPSPLLGIFYRAPKPGEPPFVEIGQEVTEDTVIGIVEVMKLMNSVRAGVCGTITDIFARNSVLVEFGEALLRVRVHE